MPSHIDPLTGQIVWSCPRCEDLLELYKLQRNSTCEGCRARELLENYPEMLNFAVDRYWRIQAVTF